MEAEGVLSRAGATPGEVRRIEMTLDPTAHRFDAGHRTRPQLSGGVFPRFARNPPVEHRSARGAVAGGQSRRKSSACRTNSSWCWKSAPWPESG
ncbi:CocE/NonD family hydrolase C-terminal non-catalytic domain-containing protein [Amycolatopsis sp. NPDC051106]|uniref:CocE/NonD family hydrolase C-terminal non-catalytic domain-containing protein n=1 Tax=unclassified Amycolatopsis TaxID=2618356 RepID=UPI0034241FB6